jgi:pyridoxal phosphate enzyme (YggS family)
VKDIAARLSAVRARIQLACARAQRDPGSVRLVAVSKFHPVSAIRAAYAAGQRDFAENYAQELAEKAAQLSDLPDLRFRFIGALQRNKAKLLVPHASAVETVASEAAARALHERAVNLGKRLEIMIQVNVAGETQKGGVAPTELSALVAAVKGLGSLDLSGLMVIPPADDLERARESYRTVRSLAEQHGLNGLSMGMSDDLELAIEEGSTSVRVGTAIFGPRPAP